MAARTFGTVRAALCMGRSRNAKTMGRGGRNERAYYFGSEASWSLKTVICSPILTPQNEHRGIQVCARAASWPGRGSRSNGTPRALEEACLAEAEMGGGDEGRPGPGEWPVQVLRSSAPWS